MLVETSDSQSLPSQAINDPVKLVQVRLQRPAFLTQPMQGSPQGLTRLTSTKIRLGSHFTQEPVPNVQLLLLAVETNGSVVVLPVPRHGTHRSFFAAFGLIPQTILTAGENVATVI